MNMPELIYEQQRRDSYKLLSVLYFLPDEETLVNLTTLAQALEKVCPSAQADLTEMRREFDLEQLRIDYARLFLGPFKLLAPPYGSVYLEDKRAVMGLSTLDATKHYTEAGLQFSEELKEAPDHIAIEMEFMYFLIFKELEAIEQSDYVQATNLLEKQRVFLTRHMGLWIFEFSDLVFIHANTSFYRNLAKITKGFLQTEQSKLPERLIMQLAQLNGGALG